MPGIRWVASLVEQFIQVIQLSIYALMYTYIDFMRWELKRMCYELAFQI
jgi:hypothetical protein